MNPRPSDTSAAVLKTRLLPTAKRAYPKLSAQDQEVELCKALAATLGLQVKAMGDAGLGELEKLWDDLETLTDNPEKFWKRWEEFLSKAFNRKRLPPRPDTPRYAAPKSGREEDGDVDVNAITYRDAAQRNGKGADKDNKQRANAADNNLESQVRSFMRSELQKFAREYGLKRQAEDDYDEATLAKLRCKRCGGKGHCVTVTGCHTPKRPFKGGKGGADTKDK